MKPKDIFGLAVRGVGLLFLYRGLSMLPTLIPTAFGGPATFFMAILMFGWPLLLAYWLLRGAPLIMRIAYPDSAQNLRREGEFREVSGNKADA